ncbi:MAG TPA: HAD family hydrolase [Pyrinomonadaceae bacterium]|jgi:phosphoglycolate phosphatase-like HAD superfamily hydrolase
MKLAVFDIDRTLTETNEVDDKCFVKAFAESHQISDIETDWTKYRHVTDSGILLEIFEKRLERAPQEKDFTAFKHCFVEKLREFADKDAKLFAEIPNAKKMLEKLRREKDWAIALATGCFYDSAELKIKAAKMNIEDFPIATADDAVSREEILRIAIEKSSAYYRQNEFEKIVSIGDGVWDLRTAKNLNLEFIGIAGGKRADKLRREGAEFLIEDFRDYKSFLEYLNK